MVVSPSLTQITVYAFATPIYAMAILLTILSVYFVVVLDDIFLSTISNLIALGIYQAYLSVAICIYALVFLRKFVFIDNSNIKNELKKIFIDFIKVIFTLFWSLILYFPLNTIVNRRNGQYTVNAFHGMSKNFIPIITIDKIIESIKSSYMAVFLMVSEHNVLGYNTTIFIRYIYLILFIITFISFLILVYRLIISKKLVSAVFTTFILLCFPICVNFLYIMTMNNINIKTDDRMFYSYIFYIIVPIFVFEIFHNINENKSFTHKYEILTFTNNLTIIKLLKSKFEKFIKFIFDKSNFVTIPKLLCILLEKSLKLVIMLIVIHNIWLAHGSYFNLYKKEESSKIYAIELAANIKSQVQYNVGDQIAFIGSVPLTNDECDYDYYSGMKYNLYINDNTDFDNLITDYAWKNFLRTFTAMDFNFVPDDLRLNLTYNPIVNNMPIYPNAGSIKKINNVIVVKLGGATLW